VKKDNVDKQKSFVFYAGLFHIIALRITLYSEQHTVVLFSFDQGFWRCWPIEIIERLRCKEEGIFMGRYLYGKVFICHFLQKQWR